MRATPSDVPRIVWMARKFHDKHKPAWPFSVTDAAQFFHNLIDSDNGLLLVTETGFAAAVANENPLSHGWLTVSQLLWWDEAGNGAELWRGIVSWAKEIGADELRCSCHPENERVRNFMSRVGEADEIIYSRAF